MIRACVFDRDEVLTYFDYQAAAAFFTSLIPVPLAELAERWRAFGGAVTWIRSFDEETQILQRFWQQLGDRYALPAASREALLAWDYTSILRPYPEVVAVLAALRRRGIKIGVLSNFRLSSIRKSLQAVHLDGFVDVAYAASAIGAKKPNASAYLTIIEAMSAPFGVLFFR